MKEVTEHDLTADRVLLTDNGVGSLPEGGGRGGGAGNPAAPTRWSKYHLVLLPSSRATKVLQVGLHLLLSSLQTL